MEIKFAQLTIRRQYWVDCTRDKVRSSFTLDSVWAVDQPAII